MYNMCLYMCMYNIDKRRREKDHRESAVETRNIRKDIVMALAERRKQTEGMKEIRGERKTVPKGGTEMKKKKTSEEERDMNRGSKRNM